MSKNVYNIVWADDEIDAILDEELLACLKEQGIYIVGKAHDGQELETILDQSNHVDAVIVDANFNATDKTTSSERDTSGLISAMGLYLYKYKKEIPFFLITSRSDSMLKEIYKHNKNFETTFPRHKRWFIKNDSDEFNDMLNEMKKAVEETRTPKFIITNRYRDEINASKFVDDITYKFVLEFLIKDYMGVLITIDEPFVKMRKTVERIFTKCQNWNLIPPIGNDVNGTAGYFLHENYRIQISETPKEYKYIYVMDIPIMEKPLAKAFDNMVDIIQDASHNKEGLKYKVDEYYSKTKDTLFLKSTMYILIDFIKWFASTSLIHHDREQNAKELWTKVDKE